MATPSYRVAVNVNGDALKPDDIDLVTYEEPPSVQHANLNKFDPKRKNHTVSFSHENPTFNLEDEPSDGATGHDQSRHHHHHKRHGEPVVHVTANGKVVKERVIMTRPDGSKVVVTESDKPHWSDYQSPVKERDLKWYRVFSIISIILFFPTGIPAFLHARKTKKLFYEGLERGDLDRAKVYAKRTERLIILSIVIALLIIVLVVALEESIRNPPSSDTAGFGRANP